MAEPSQPAKIIGVRDLSPSVRELMLLPVKWKIGFLPGQWVSLRLPVGERPPLVRAYSMAEAEAPSGRLVLVFDQVPGGLGSGYLYTLKEQDEVEISGPYGNFLVPGSLPDSLVLIARFTGVVPIRCILRHLVLQPAAAPRVTLIYGIPHPENQLYHVEFLELARTQSSFHYLPVVLSNNESPELQLLQSLWAGRKDFFPMICGVKEFVRPIKSYLSEVGFVRKEMKVETYD
jgi:NAD(P)H-flavin reductase